MKIDKAEIERIIDDFETKAEKSNESRKKSLGSPSYFRYTAERDTYDYAAAVLRQALHD